MFVAAVFSDREFWTQFLTVFMGQNHRVTFDKTIMSSFRPVQHEDADVVTTDLS